MSDVQFLIMKNLKLQPAERDFFTRVRRAIVANPFSDERAAVDSQLTETKTPLSSEKQLSLIHI